ncbi:hypothetical protein EVJ58_g4879 [Rhodofomes roseus]|uniref:Protein kinase domain-containing protein n=1 Tax=Rhodofomes roseus TaxID=34475 RepID=A0A4Y9YGM6_9APHY|nr:hypothetical protein EVJ58_g4879 [Rhodofomes roseus]
MIYVMWDDRPEAQNRADSPPGARELSPWVDWRPNPDAPLLSILVMARGGHKFSVVKDDRDPSNQEDVKQLLDDLSSCYLLHSDLRASNIIRAPRDTEECQLQKRVHRWNIIDLVWTTIDDPEPNDAKYAVIWEFQRGNWDSRHFAAQCLK